MAKKKTKFKKDLKKTLRKSNKGSNKLIYAVAGGLAIVLIIFILVVTAGDKKPVNKEQAMLDSINYVVKRSDVAEVKAIPEEDKVIIRYKRDTSDGNNKKVDYRRMARFAGIRVWNAVRPEEIKVLLQDVERKEKDYFVVIKDGAIESDRLLDPAPEEPAKENKQEENEKKEETGKNKEAGQENKDPESDKTKSEGK